MSIMLQSSKAQDRILGVWFQSIQQGQVKFPRVQRFEIWDRSRALLIEAAMKQLTEKDAPYVPGRWSGLNAVEEAVV
ncbi:TPA: hypothetical protein U8209_001229 [Pseudomonas putida]|nr:hypothetical protein F7661_08705 [Pseudomonas sp. CFA]HEN8704796.1 hypothetical protein [Pseudomonas putida]